MKTIRHDIFETNSSSTHSIAISKKNIDVKELPSSIHFAIGEFGWEHDIADRADYFYTALLLTYGKEETPEAVKHVEEVLSNVGIKSTFEIPKWYENHDWLKEGYIDHCEIGEFVYALMNDDQMLLRYLFGDSVVYTGNDNTEHSNDNATKYVAKSKVWVWDENMEREEYVDNPYHDETKYDYFFKGN